MFLRLLSAGSQHFEHIVVTLKKEERSIAPQIRALEIPVYELGLRWPVPSLSRALSLRPLTRHLQPDLIQGWMNHGNLMAILASGSLPNRVPVIWNVRQSLKDFKGKLPTRAIIRANAYFSRRAETIVYVSQTGRKQHEAIGYHSAKGLVIPNGIDCSTFVPDEASRCTVRGELGLPSDGIIIGLIARYDPVKDHRGFIRAAAMVAPIYPDVRFLLIGPGMETARDLQVLIRELHLQGRVYLIGERADMPRLNASLDIACSASRAEGFSNAIIEAMACGVPCVVTDVGDSAYVVDHTGIAVRSGDPEAFAAALRNLIFAGPEYRRQLGIKARRRVEREFSLVEVTRRYEELYRTHEQPGLATKAQAAVAGKES